MHKLTRPTIPPTCLSKYQHGRHNWDNVTSADKIAIWDKLDEMQQKRCAYCETSIRSGKQNNKEHIEHLRPRRCSPQGTFLWSNLFGSCNRKDSCGKYKDNPKLLQYDQQDLIKMDKEDPEFFLTFLPDGRVVPAKGLNSADKKRAVETIRVFNLNGSLRRIRESTITGYLQTAEEITSYATVFDEEDWLSLLEDELNKIKDKPFATAIKHTLQP